MNPYVSRYRDASRNTSAANKLFKRCTILVATLLVIGSFTPFDTSIDSTYATGSIEVQSPETLLISDSEGYLTKMNPQTISGDRSTMNDYLVHTVAPGETLSTIAALYNLKTSTLLWENGISNANSIRAGKQLVIPPVDGLTHTVQKGETVEKVAKTYDIKPEAIKQQNRLASSTLTVGQDIFLPGAKPIVADVDIRTTPSRTGTNSRVVAATGGTIIKSENLPKAAQKSAGGNMFIFPTNGKITQGFHAGHYAYDIGNRSQPPIWAAGAGKVILAKGGCARVSYGCNGGYGNHVIIDHGNGVQTLYGHLEYLNVKVGDYVNQGDVLGKMGRSGNVRGATGIHLHWEVRVNGKKMAPANYY